MKVKFPNLQIIVAAIKVLFANRNGCLLFFHSDFLLDVPAFGGGIPPKYFPKNSAEF